MSYMPSVDEIRHRRDRFLQMSDIYMYVDKWETYSPEQKSAWANFRQALRDIPEQAGFPTTVTWPVPPVNLILEKPEGWPEDWP